MKTLRIWFDVGSTPDQRQSALEFAKKLLFLGPKQILGDEIGFNFFGDLIVSFLSRGSTWAFKNDVLDLLAPFLLHCKDGLMLGSFSFSPLSLHYLVILFTFRRLHSLHLTSLLGFFTLPLPGKVVKGAVANMVTYDFPLTSTELPEDSAPQAEYKTSLTKLFGALVATKSGLLLETLFPVLREVRYF